MKVYDNIPTLVTVVLFLLRARDITCATIGRGVYSYIRVMPNRFLLKST